jgi:hypothetical protein
MAGSSRKPKIGGTHGGERGLDEMPQKIHASIRTRAILALCPSGERVGKDPAHHAEILVRAELE